MGQSILYDGLDRAQLLDVLSCFGAIIKKYSAGEKVMLFPSDNISERTVGIIISGTARLATYDAEGELYLSQLYDGEGIFGSMFINSTSEDCFALEAMSAVEIAYTDFERISEFCENACASHIRFTRNLYRLIANQSKEASLRLNVLSKKTMREKLMSYFLFCAAERSSNEFNINIILSELSKYLCVDRSSMMRELKKMKDDGIIISKGSHIRIIST